MRRGVTGDLLYVSADGWRPVPQWATFFRHLGRAAVTSYDGARRLVAGVVVPTRQFAAAFVALGAVEGRLVSDVAVPDSEEHFEELASLERGTEVTVLQAHKKYVASFDRAVGAGRKGIYVTYDRDSMSHFVPAEECHRVVVGKLGRKQLPRVATQRGAVRRGWDAHFVEGILPVGSADEYARRDDFTALIIGQLRTLRLELERAEFSVRDSAGTVRRGHLEDLIRTKKFASDVVGDTFRTEVMSSSARSLDPDLAALKPPVVVFDGGRGFLRHRSDWESASMVVILDRSSHDIDEAAAVMNQIYIETRLDDTDPLGTVQVPPAVEITSFLARCS